MSKSLLSISPATLRAAPFFILNGPDGRTLTCQWTSMGDHRQHMNVSEFEIVCPETPETMGCLFGLFDAREGTFTMRAAIRRIPCETLSSAHTIEFVPEYNLDLNWQGDLNDVLDHGHDLDMGPDGLLIISDIDADLTIASAA